MRKFLRDTSGAAAVVFALSAIPAIGVVGIGIDYFTALANKVKLDAAADSAAITALTATQAFISANSSKESDPQLTTDAIAAGNAQAVKAFNTNAGALLARLAVTPKVNIVKTAQTLQATVTWTGTSPTAFGKMFKVANFNMTGLAASSVSMGAYLDFYLALDTSGSMGLPTSTDGQKKLMNLNPDQRSTYTQGCQFACHYQGYQGYTVARNNNITLRIDSVINAVMNLIGTARSTQTLQNQYRIGIYPFIDNLMQAYPLSSSYLSMSQSDLNSAAAGFANTYLDSGLNNNTAAPMGAGGTHFENLFPSGPGGLMKYIQTFGDGSSATKSKPFVFIVTDGMDNDQTYTGNFDGSKPQRTTQQSLPYYCQNAQAKGVTVAILYIPYQPIYDPDPSFAGGEDITVNNVIPYIPQDLQSCASPGFFFTANTDADINTAMQAMFAQAQKVARLTQ